MRNKNRTKEELYKEFSEFMFSQAQATIEEFMIGSMSKSLQMILEEEVSDFLGRRWYERHDEEEPFMGYRNGYQDCCIRCSAGRMHIKKPRVRENPAPYESRILARLDALEESFKNLVLEAYVRGLSTRDIEETFRDKDGKPLLSRTSVSNIAKSLNDDYEEFSRRDLSEYDIVYLFVDAVYEAVRKYTNNQSLLCAWAITSSGEKLMLGLEAVASESEASWSLFFEDMIRRGLPQPLLIISDGHPGLLNAITRSFPQSDRQRCIAHKLRNIMVKVPQDYQEEVLKAVKSIYYAQDYQSAKVIAEEFIKRYSDRFPSAVKCFIDDLEACLVHLKYPASHHKYIRTTNLIERAFEEQKRRTKVFPQHQNEKGVVGLVFAVLIRASRKWNRIKMTSFEMSILKNIKKLICPSDKDDNKLSFRRAA